MALKCPECGTTAHTRTSAYESATVKRTWYQCTNLDCSCTFTALESVEKIIMKPQKPAESAPAAETLSAARRDSRRRWAATATPAPAATATHSHKQERI